MHEPETAAAGERSPLIRPIRAGIDPFGSRALDGACSPRAGPSGHPSLSPRLDRSIDEERKAFYFPRQYTDPSTHRHHHRNLPPVALVVGHGVSSFI